MTLISLINHRGIAPHQLFCFLRDEIKEHFVFIDDGIEDGEKEAIREGFRSLGLLHRIEHECACEIHDEDSEGSLEALIRFAHSKVARGELLIDVTEALGTTAAMLSAELLTTGAKFVSYNPEENEITVFDKYKKHSFAPKRKFGIADRVAALGFYMERINNLENIELLRPLIYAVFESPKRFDEVRNRLKSGQKLSKTDPLYEPLLSLNAITQNGAINDKNKKMIDGELFELFCAVTIADMGFDSVATGVVIEFGDDVRHEFDILALQGNRLHVCECKYTASFNPDSIIFKYDALRGHLDPYAKAIIFQSGSGAEDTFDIGDKKRADAFDMGILSMTHMDRASIEDFVGSFLLGRESRGAGMEEKKSAPVAETPRKATRDPAYTAFTDIEGYKEFKQEIDTLISSELKNHLGYKVFKGLDKIPNRIDRLLSIDESFDTITAEYLREFWQSKAGKRVGEALKEYNEACRNADRASQERVINGFLES